MTNEEMDATLRRRQELYIASKDLAQRSLDDPSLKVQLDAAQEELRQIAQAIYQHNHPR